MFNLPEPILGEHMERFKQKIPAYSFFHKKSSFSKFPRNIIGDSLGVIFSINFYEKHAINNKKNRMPFLYKKKLSNRLIHSDWSNSD